MEGDEDDDCEVVLKGSELYNHLLNCSSEDFDFYDKNYFCDSGRPTERVIKTSITKVPTELLTYLDAILNSNILLDEDVSYLYGYTVDLISDLRVQKHWRFLFTGILGISSFAAAINYSSLLRVDHFFNIFTSIKYYYYKWQRLRLLTNVITKVKQIHLYYKKTSQILYEQNAYFKLHEFKTKSNGQTNEFDILEKKKKAEIDTMSNILCQCILDNIHRISDATKTLIDKLPLIQAVDSKEHYLVFMTDKQLGLPDLICPEQSISSTQSLESLKNIYLLMQSEFFRRLGLCFCPTLWLNEESLLILPTIFDVIQNYLNSCTEILSVVTFFYKKHLYPEKLDKGKLRNATLIGGYSAIHKVSSSLTELIMDSRILEEFVENSKKYDEREISLICRRLEEIKTGLNFCIDNVISAEKYFIKLRPIQIVNDNEVNEEKTDSESNKIMTSVEVGKFSQNITGKDNVYFAITEADTKLNEMDDLTDIEPVQLPNFILTELKEVLFQKKNEFNDREIKAVENPDEYKKFLETPEIKPEETKKTKHDTYHCPSDFTMHKMLASAVAQRSSNFMNQNEEQFGSSDESDDSS